MSRQFDVVIEMIQKGSSWRPCLLYPVAIRRHPHWIH